MKTVRKQIKLVALLLALLVLFQGCTVYKSTPISLERAAQNESKVKVKTNLVGDEHTPVYNTAFGTEGIEPTYVDSDNPLPTALPGITEENPLQVKLTNFTPETDTAILLKEISGKLDILIQFDASLNKIDYTEI